MSRQIGNSPMIKTARIMFLTLTTLTSSAFGQLTAQQIHEDDLPIIDIRANELSRPFLLPTGKAKIIRLSHDVRDVLVADPEIADLVIKTPRTIYIIGKKIGNTNAFFMGSDGGKTLKLEISIQIDTHSIDQTIKNLMPGTNVKVTAAKNHLFLTGNVRSPVISENIRQIAIRFVENESNVVNLIKVSEDQQVMLKVKISEVQRGTVREFGIDLASTTNFGALAATTATVGSFTTPAFAAGSFTVADVADSTLTVLLSALENQGLVKTLAEPNLTAISGESANFLAGGEFPVVTVGNNGQSEVEFKPFGVTLDFTPVVLDSGRISLQIATEVSALSTQGAVTLNNFTIPALTVRRAKTTVELPSGGSLVIAGLLDDAFRTQVQGIPGLKDLPILGPLFRSQEFQTEQSELVVAVTPFLVRPVAQSAITFPTDGLKPPTNLELYYRGQTETREPAEQAAPPTLRQNKTHSNGYIVE